MARANRKECWEDGIRKPGNQEKRINPK